MDIIVTTPKSEMANAAREAADVIAAGGRRPVVPCAATGRQNLARGAVWQLTDDDFQECRRPPWRQPERPSCVVA